MNYKVYYRKIIDRIKPFINDNEILVIHSAKQVGKTTLLHYMLLYLDHNLKIQSGDIKVRLLKIMKTILKK